ncbi:MAG: hypothetical protein ACI9V8_000528 [Urechidicola sp.]
MASLEAGCEVDNDLADVLTLLDPNLEAPLPAVTPGIESAPTESLSQELAASVVSLQDIRKGQDNREEFQPPPPLEFEPTIEPVEFNQLHNDVAPRPITLKNSVPNRTMLKAAFSNGPTPKGKEVAQSKPVATDAIHWTELSYDLGLQGFAQAIAINSVVGHYEQDHLQLFLTPDFMKFVNPENQDEICQAIASKLGLSLILDLQTQDKLDAETPSETRLRKQQEQRQAAIESIKQEQTVKKLQRAFGAELVESSVQLMDERSG